MRTLALIVRIKYLDMIRYSVTLSPLVGRGTRLINTLLVRSFANCKSIIVEVTQTGHGKKKNVTGKIFGTLALDALYVHRRGKRQAKPSKKQQNLCPNIETRSRPKGFRFSPPRKQLTAHNPCQYPFARRSVRRCDQCISPDGEKSPIPPSKLPSSLP